MNISVQFSQLLINISIQTCQFHCNALFLLVNSIPNMNWRKCTCEQRQIKIRLLLILYRLVRHLIRFLQFTFNIFQHMYPLPIIRRCADTQASHAHRTRFSFFCVLVVNGFYSSRNIKKRAFGHVLRTKT